MTSLTFSALFTASYLVLWFLVLISAGSTLAVLRHIGLARLKTVEGVQGDGLALGSVAPSIKGVGQDGNDEVREFARGRSTLLMFVAPGCVPCGKVLPYVEALHAEGNGRSPLIDVVLVVSGGPGRIRDLLDETSSPLDCVAEGSGTIFDEFEVRVTPFAFIIGPDGLVQAKGLCGDPIRLEAMLAGGGISDAASILTPLVEGYKDEIRRERRSASHREPAVQASDM